MHVCVRALKYKYQSILFDYKVEKMAAHNWYFYINFNLRLRYHITLTLRSPEIRKMQVAL